MLIFKKIHKNTAYCFIYEFGVKKVYIKFKGFFNVAFLGIYECNTHK